MLRKLYPIEILVVVFGIASAIISFLIQVPLRPIVPFYLSRMTNGLQMYAFGLIVCLLIFRLASIEKKKEKIAFKDTWQKFSEAYLSKQRIISDIRLLNAVCLMFVVFISLKHFVPLFNLHFFGSERLQDKMLLNLESSIFGSDLTSLSISLFGSEVAQTFSAGYMLFYPYMAILVFLFVLQRKQVLAQEFFAAFSLCWFLGIVWVYIYPTLGPCFFKPEIVSALEGSASRQTQIELWKLREYVLANPGSEGGTYLISGLPSLHVAVVALGTYYILKLSKLLALVSALVLLITLLTTVYFGWHYLADDLAAFLLVWLCVFLSKKWVGSLDEA